MTGKVEIDSTLTLVRRELAAQELLQAAVRRFSPERLALVSSFGAEGMVLIDLMCSLVPRPRVITVDTGRLPQETYDLMDEARRRFPIELEVYLPDTQRVERMVREKGPNLFYESVANRKQCCGVRKVEPLDRALTGVDAWITGIRRDQTASRSATPKTALDPLRPNLWKIAPIADWSEADVWTYLRNHGVPYNALHDRGFPSIGCAPCTRAVGSGSDPRSGRWWWEQNGDQECGLHVDPRNGRLSRFPDPQVPIAIDSD